MAQIPITNGSCPNCGKKISNYAANKYLYGTPIRYCKKCKGAYVDPNYHEIAIDGFPPTEMSAKTGLKSALFGLAVFVVCGGLFAAEFMFSERIHTIFPIMTILGFVTMISGIVDSIRVKSGAKAGSMEKLKQESVMRLQNQQYAVQLKELGYNVPEQYLPQGYVQSVPMYQQPVQQFPQYGQPAMPYQQVGGNPGQQFVQPYSQQPVQQFNQPAQTPMYQQPIQAPQEYAQPIQQQPEAVQNDAENIQQ